MNKLFLSIWVLVVVSGISFSCKQDPDVITNTIRDTIEIRDTIIILDTITQFDTIIQTLEDTATTFILVRHAETTGGGSDPNLSTQGQERAIELSRILERMDLDAVYSTDFNRTKETAQPTADSMGIIVQIYDPFGLNAFINTVLTDHHNGFLLVVGHSNTTPDLINKLIGENRYSTFPETEYDNLFVVNVFERGRAKVIHLKY